MLPTTRPHLAVHNAAIRRALLPPLIALAILLGLLLWLVSLLVSASRWVEHSDEVIAQIHESLTLMVDAETGVRGYLASGNPLFLEPYQRSQTLLPDALNELKQLVRDNSGQTVRIKTLESTYSRWAVNARAMMALRQRGDTEWIIRFNGGRGKSLMDRVRQQVGDFIKDETALRRERESRVQDATRNALVGGGLGGVVLGGLLVRTTRHQMHVLSDQYESVLREEQAARERALHERERFLATLTSIGDGVMVTDAKGVVTLINPVTERLTGWTQQEAVGKDSKEVFRIFHEETGAAVACPIDEVIRENRLVLLENHTALRHKNSTKVVIEDSAAPVRNAAGGLEAVVLVFRDVTERKERELQIHAASEALRDSVVQQRRLVREMLASVTGGRLRLVDSEEELPALLSPASDVVELTQATLRVLRRQVQAVSEKIGLSDERAHDLLTAAGEAAMNAVQHAGGGTGQVYADSAHGLIQVRIQDRGEGIREEDLHRATLEKGWSGGGSLGHGFYLILRCVDRTYLLTSPQGTTVILEQEHTPPQPDWLKGVTGETG
jgi:PAS domain S-box-containing protein